MSSIEQLTITLPSETAAKLKDAANSGDRTTSDVVCEAIAEWAERREDDRKRRESLRAAIREGFESGSPIQADAVFAELRARYAPML